MEPTFLFPKSTQYGRLDLTAGLIVMQLKFLNWNYPGITVKLSTFHNGKYQLVEQIKGPDFKLDFGRSQGSLPDSVYSDLAGLFRVTIPRSQLSLFSDFSGPTLVQYIGPDWEADQAWFMTEVKVMARLRHEPRRYLTYTGSDMQTSVRRGVPQGIARYLAADSNEGQEYSPQGDEAKVYVTKDALNHVDHWLSLNVVRPLMLRTMEGG